MTVTASLTSTGRWCGSMTHGDRCLPLDEIGSHCVTLTDQDWQARLASLVDQLAGGGALSSPAWRTAFDAVPRHVFVPTVLTDDGAGPTAVSGHDPARREAWLDLVYTDTSLVTQYLEHPSIRTVADRPLLVSTSSSTMPSLIRSPQRHNLPVGTAHVVC
jgi:hypothetical protein